MKVFTDYASCAIVVFFCRKWERICGSSNEQLPALYFVVEGDDTVLPVVSVIIDPQPPDANAIPSAPSPTVIACNKVYLPLDKLEKFVVDEIKDDVPSLAFMRDFPYSKRHRICQGSCRAEMGFEKVLVIRTKNGKHEKLAHLNCCDSNSIRSLSILRSVSRRLSEEDISSLERFL
ncbi:hypothetical protein PFISCL1PPCAC_22485 [Pristionchus fissidentatus]|uniref:Uncharacterized protein n=1 Tax=Pristionchus fissidentatus TaxID=1538716 RepID=A0AAV5WIE2_9BILA|nr:hypothetical protein PFISCL1PPCAC_22485 [Pristionchus fissidentatus]